LNTMVANLNRIIEDLGYRVTARRYPFSDWSKRRASNKWIYRLERTPRQ
jgi:hypothetical protein